MTVTENDTQSSAEPYRTVAYPIAGGEPAVICQTFCTLGFSQDGKYMELQVNYERQYHILPLRKDTGLPEMPKGGFPRETGTKELLKGLLVKARLDSAVSPEKYSYTKENIRRNIFRVPMGGE